MHKEENMWKHNSKKTSSEKLAAYCQKTGYEIKQVNGQRIYSVSDSQKIPLPPKGTEIFIGHLPKKIYEYDIIPLLEKFGRLYNFRLMLDFFGNTRGYAFATYFNSEEASRAIQFLNGYEIRPNFHIGVYRSVDNCRLFVGNLPVEKTKEEIFNMLSTNCEGIRDIIWYPNKANGSFNRGFVFAEFENHRLAAMARRQFTPNNILAWGKRLHVDWAEPIPEVDPLVMAKVSFMLFFIYYF